MNESPGGVKDNKFQSVPPFPGYHLSIPESSGLRPELSI